MANYSSNREDDTFYIIDSPEDPLDSDNDALMLQALYETQNEGNLYDVSPANGNAETPNVFAPQPGVTGYETPSSSVLAEGESFTDTNDLLTFPIVEVDHDETPADVGDISSSNHVVPSISSSPSRDSSSSGIPNFPVVKLLPKKIPQATLHAVDALQQMLKTTVAKKIELSCKGKINATLVDLSLPTSYADTLKNDRSLVAAIVKPIFSVIENITELVLPEVSLSTLCYLLGSDENVLQEVRKCLSIQAHFFSESNEEVLKLLPKVVEHLVRHLSPANIECFQSVNGMPAESKNFCTQLKKEKGLIDMLKTNSGAKSGTAICLKYNGHAITKGEKNPRKRISLIDSGSSSKRLKQADKKKSIKKRPIKLELIHIPKENVDHNTLFTFDALQLQPVTDTVEPFTAYSYWQLEKIHRRELWPSTGVGTTVAIVDSGIEPSHPAFNLKIGADNYFNLSGDMSVDPTASSHGTLCAGIAAGSEFGYGNDSLNQNISNVVRFSPGVAPDAKLMIYKVIAFGKLEADCECVLQALCDIDNRSDIDVVSLSLGSLKFVPSIRKGYHCLSEQEHHCCMRGF